MFEAPSVYFQCVNESALNLILVQILFWSKLKSFTYDICNKRLKQVLEMVENIMRKRENAGYRSFHKVLVHSTGNRSSNWYLKLYISIDKGLNRTEPSNISPLVMFDSLSLFAYEIQKSYWIEFLWFKGSSKLRVDEFSSYFTILKD